MKCRVLINVAMTIDKAKSDDESSFFMHSLVRLATTVCSVVGANPDTLEVGTSSIIIDRLRQSTGLLQLLEQDMIPLNPKP